MCHQVYVEICTDLIHRRLADQEKEGETDDPMGSDAHRQELELDALKNDMETELLAPGSLIGHYAPTISKFCHSLASFIETPLPVQISLSCALMKLMSIDGVFCQNNIRLIFTLLQHRQGSRHPCDSPLTCMQKSGERDQRESYDRNERFDDPFPKSHGAVDFASLRSLGNR